MTSIDADTLRETEKARLLSVPFSGPDAKSGEPRFGFHEKWVPKSHSTARGLVAPWLANAIRSEVARAHGLSDCRLGHWRSSLEEGLRT